jgi:hypothetical protein
MDGTAFAVLLVGIGLTISLTLTPHTFEGAPLWIVSLCWFAGLSLAAGGAVYLSGTAWLHSGEKLPGSIWMRWRCLSFAEAARKVLQAGEQGELGAAYPAGGQPEEKLRWCMNVLIASGIEFSGRRPPFEEVRAIRPAELSRLRPRLGSNDLMDETGNHAQYRDVGVGAAPLGELLREMRSTRW